MQSFQAISVGQCSVDASTIDHMHPYPRTGSRVFESICRHCAQEAMRWADDGAEGPIERMPGDAGNDFDIRCLD